MKKVFIWLLLAAFIAVGAWLFFFRSPEGVVFEAVSAVRRDLIQEVSVTGTVTPVKKADLAFDQGGIVSDVLAKVGDTVVVGQVLIELDSAEAGARLREAEAALRVQSLRLDELRRGTRPEAVRIAATSVENAERALADAKKSLTQTEAKAAVDLSSIYGDVSDVLQQALLRANDAVNKQTESFFENGDSDDPRLTFPVGRDAQVEIDMRSARLEAGKALSRLRDLTDSLTSAPEDLEISLEEAGRLLDTIRRYLIQANEAVNKATGLSPAVIGQYKTDVSLARDILNVATSSVTNQLQMIDSQRALNESAVLSARSSLTQAENVLENARKELDLKRAGATLGEIEVQEAQALQAEAGVRAAKVQLEKRRLRAPFSGLVTRIDADPGEIASFGLNGSSDNPRSVVSLMSLDSIEIETYVPEVDIAKIKVGDRATLTLDAYGSGETFDARVTFIDPAETVKEGIPTYKTVLQLVKPDSRVKSGMTANVDIETANRHAVIAVPQRAILQKDGESIVRVAQGAGESFSFSERKVVPGLRASDGYTEIIHGLQEGENVVLFIQE